MRPYNIYVVGAHFYLYMCVCVFGQDSHALTPVVPLPDFCGRSQLLGRHMALPNFFCSHSQLLMAELHVVLPNFCGCSQQDASNQKWASGHAASCWMELLVPPPWGEAGAGAWKAWLRSAWGRQVQGVWGTSIPPHPSLIFTCAPCPTSYNDSGIEWAGS